MRGLFGARSVVVRVRSGIVRGRSRVIQGSFGGLSEVVRQSLGGSFEDFSKKNPTFFSQIFDFFSNFFENLEKYFVRKVFVLAVRHD